jgi:hypothetical protein
VERGEEASVTRLDALLDRSVDDLEVLYEKARVPRLGAVRGDLRGRMLATTVLKGRWAERARRWAGSPYFVWRGKSFSPETESAGEGINRVVLDRFRLYRFETSIGPSKAGDFDALHLDYDLPENPGFIRVIEDEIRELSPGLWLGQAYLRIGGQSVLILYFGLTEK